MSHTHSVHVHVFLLEKNEQSLQHSNLDAYEPECNEYLEEWNFSKNNTSFEASVRKH